ncbi:SAP domain-containing protein [Geobacter grbiciae]|uniref:SAP domain-containing protein n=1 Tax=Geobacter grbiciae TaxID=155042 RepID=UPI001C010E13|nr:SAP domain-containing protein [Geobacter grbiciae]MBT1077285.1 SAP domain-containing protein [Geobacter grbiciae]
MEIQKIKQIARKLGVQSAKMNKSELIRAIQSAESNIPCFDKGKATECGQASCLWREDCN